MEQNVVPAIRRSVGQPISLHPEDLANELKDILAKDGYLWDISDLSIQPAFLVALFDKINDIRFPEKHSFAIDLDANRLGNTSVEQYRQVLAVIHEKPRLLVRFGFEIFAPNLEQAMTETNTMALYDQRVFINQPWLPTGLSKYAENVEKHIEKVEEHIEKVEKHIEKADDILKATQKRITKLEEKERKDHTEELRQIRSYQDTESRALEHAVTRAVYEILTSAEIVVNDRYSYKGHIGDIDGLVVGTDIRNESVVVLIEVKHNIDTSSRKAVLEMKESYLYWKRLCQLANDENDSNIVDEDVIADYQRLHIAAHKNRKVVFAFGGVSFSESTTIDRNFKSLPADIQRYRVVPNHEGRFVASTME